MIILSLKFFEFFLTSPWLCSWLSKSPAWEKNYFLLIKNLLWIFCVFCSKTTQAWNFAKKLTLYRITLSRNKNQTLPAHPFCIVLGLSFQKAYMISNICRNLAWRINYTVVSLVGANNLIIYTKISIQRRSIPVQKLLETKIPANEENRRNRITRPDLPRD